MATELKIDQFMKVFATFNKEKNMLALNSTTQAGSRFKHDGKLKNVLKNSQFYAPKTRVVNEAALMGLRIREGASVYLPRMIESPRVPLDANKTCKKKSMSTFKSAKRFVKLVLEDGTTSPNRESLKVVTTTLRGLDASASPRKSRDMPARSLLSTASMQLHSGRESIAIPFEQNAIKQCNNVYQVLRTICWSKESFGPQNNNAAESTEYELSNLREFNQKHLKILIVNLESFERYEVYDNISITDHQLFQVASPSIILIVCRTGSQSAQRSFSEIFGSRTAALECST